MTDTENLQFTDKNFQVCCYCRYRLGASYDGCFFHTEKRGRYAQLFISDKSVEISRAHGMQAFNVYLGCDDLEPSGLPAYPSVKKELVRRNHKAQEIPSDPNATETGEEFVAKMYEYPNIHPNIDEV